MLYDKVVQKHNSHRQQVLERTYYMRKTKVVTSLQFIYSKEQSYVDYRDRQFVGEN